MAAIILTGAWWSQLDISWAFTDFRVREGELWRLATSCLPHVDLLHLAFNLYWLWSFGTLVEQHFGSVRTIGLYLLFAVGSSAAEYALLEGGVGLSGVGYGLFAMLWVLSRRDPRFSGSVDRNTIVLFVGWFLLCVALTLADIWHVGNVAHASGTGLGLLVGYALSKRDEKFPKLRWWLVATAFVVSTSSLFARRFINLSPNVGTDLASSGYTELTGNRPEKAISLLQEAVSLNPGKADWWFNLGIARERLGQSANAADAYQHALAIEPSRVETGRALAQLEDQLAFASYGRGEFTRAVGLYREAARLDPSDSSHWYNLGIALQAAGSLAQAVTSYERAVELDPKNASYQEALHALDGASGTASPEAPKR
jgi:membrane associated rhomboid family serine protease